jgi:hypothetical protein
MSDFNYFAVLFVIYIIAMGIKAIIDINKKAHTGRED